jgi:hypothetical protein
MVGSQLCDLFNRYKSSRQFESRQLPFSSPPARFCLLAAVLRHAHREVGVTVPAKVSGREGQAKGLTYARDPRNPATVLAPHLTSRRCQPGRRSEQDMNHARILQCADVLLPGIDSHVRVPALAEITRGRRESEGVLCLRARGDPAAVLGPPRWRTRSIRRLNRKAPDRRRHP